MSDFFRILFKDENLVAVDKPSGLASQPQPQDDDGKTTAVSLLLLEHPELKKEFPNSIEPGLLHRLDVETSGVLLFARTEAAFLRMKQAWSDHEIKKTYRALVDDPKGALKNLKFPHILNWPMAHSKNHRSRMIVLDRPEMRVYRGKKQDALTKILADEPHGQSHDLTIEIVTGVMHQIRCHLAFFGTPILGDELYRGPLDKPEAWRMMLHAWKLQVPAHVLGQAYEFESPIPWRP